MKISTVLLALACLALALSVPNLSAQKGTGGSGGGTSGNAGGGGGGSQGGGGQGGGGGQAGGQQGSSLSAAPSNRIEVTMEAYEGSDRIAAHIADRIQKHTLYVYDSQTFASIQTYDSYAVTVSAFEMSFRFFTTAAPGSSFVTGTQGAQTIISSLAAMRSTAEYATDTVNYQLDPLIAQVANQLAARVASPVIVPKFLLLSANDLAVSTPLPTSNCSAITYTIPDQLGCLLTLRNNAAVAAQAGDDSQKAAFADLDKLFQVFFSTMMGTSVNLSANANSPQGGGGGGGADAPGGAAPGGGGAGAPLTNANGAQQAPSSQSNQSVSVPLLSQIIQGHRLESLFRNDSKSRVLVLEPTEAGGGSRIKHFFWQELFWPTPTPSFTGGAIVTYLLIDPSTNVVESSGVFRFMVDYGKFHGAKIQAPRNF